MGEPERDEPLHVIGVAAELVASHPQTLRMYERVGLVQPRRTAGNARLYSARDLERIRRIQSYTEMGVNLAGVEIIFRLLDQIERLEAEAMRRRQELRREVEAELTDQLQERLRKEREA